MKTTVKFAVGVPLVVGTVVAALTLPRLVAEAQEGSRVDRTATTKEADGRVNVTFSGGYETDPRDRGRPVALIAAALDVPQDVFRKAFSGVTPASGGRAPEPRQVRENKSALLKVLGPLGVTNERLDEVSNYYRYNRQRGEMWRHAPAEAYATVQGGKVVGFTITKAGSGYSSAPEISIPGFGTVGCDRRMM